MRVDGKTFGDTSDCGDRTTDDEDIDDVMDDAEEEGEEEEEEDEGGLEWAVPTMAFSPS